MYCDHFPTGGRKKGWKADSYFRTLLGVHGLININNLRDDDLFLVFDIDEIPSMDSLAFLKFHNGYPEPFGLRYQWSVFGYFWKNTQYSQVTIGCTVGMLKYVYLNDSNIIRDIEHGLNAKFHPYLEVYKENHKQIPLWSKVVTITIDITTPPAKKKVDLQVAKVEVSLP
ncbi:hypothetical protein QZH41_004467 [Actinostola sp. cb2023]|nr:hypothetical protein QZH41_004467 [Actinostola sp. cb2023]